MLTKEEFLKNKKNCSIKISTEEIFWKVVDKLIELGWGPFNGNDKSSLWFANYIFLPYYRDETLEIHPRPNVKGEEIQVSDIIGLTELKPQFEVGKWYSFKGHYNYIARFKEVKNNKFITDIGRIENGIYVPDVNSNGVIDINREFTEISLEEIQQYLPDNHPDKVKSTKMKEYVKERKK